MAAKPAIAMVGAGNLGTALTWSLRSAGYTIEAVIARPGSASRKKARRLAREVGAQTIAGVPDKLRAEVIWFCVPDANIKSVAESWGKKLNWEGRVALHSSGALTSDKLAALRQRGAAVASVHPFMTFVRGSGPALEGVPFALEGDTRGTRVARRIVKDLGGRAFSIRKSDKAAYHAWGTFSSPLLVALLETAEHVAALAGVKPAEARRRMIPILRQTLANYAASDAAGAFSGPIIRGDFETVKRHLGVLQKSPIAIAVYRSLALAAADYLPGKNKETLKRQLKSH